MNPKFIFIISNIHLPRCVNRVREFHQRGYKVEVYYFDRTIFNNKVSELDVPMHSLGELEAGSGSYFKRMPKQYSIINAVVKKHKKENVVFYLFGFDIALIYHYCFTNKPYIFEESDLRHTYFPNALKKVLEIVDKRIIKKSLMTVFTSEGFCEYHFGDKIPENVAFIPNRLSPIIKSVELLPHKKYDKDKLSIGFVGSPRFKAVYNFIKVFCSNFPQYEMHLFGEPCLDGIEELRGKYPNCTFHGTFTSPQDLPTIYSSIDLVLSTYDAGVENVRYAEPNKIYESMFFEVPIIVSKNTFLSSKVERLGIGYSIDAADDNEIVSFVKSLTEESVKARISNTKKIDKNTLVSINDCFYQKLNAMLKEL